MNRLTWMLVLIGVGLNAAAQLLLKTATRPLAHLTELGWDTLRYSVVSLGTSLPFWTGMLCYGMSVCVWIAALSKAPVSTAYPMLSLGYVVVAAVAVLGMGETLSVWKAAGIVLICVGVVLVSRS